MSRTPRVLIVDDNPGAIEALEGVLAGQGYDLITAASGREALRTAAQQPPDLILLDVMMPDIDGFEVCRRIRADARLAAVPIVMVTALDDKESRITGIEAGADDFVTKPIDRGELRARVKMITTLNRYRRLLEERERFDQLFDLSPDGILVVDTEGTIRLANPQARAMLYPGGSPLGEPFARFLGPADRAHWGDLLGEASRDGALPSYEEVELVPEAGPPIATEIAVGRLHLEGEPAVQLIIRDVSERIRMKEEVERSQRLDAIGRATSGVVHDFNNLLQTARISAEILLRKLGRDGEHAAALNDIVSVTEEGAALTKQLLVFARQGSLDRKEVDLNAVVTDVEQILRHVVGKRCDLQLNLSDEPLPVEGDPTQIVQVLTNLVVNARDALEGSGSIRLTTRMIGPGGSPPALNGRSAALLKVEDDGIGMDRETLAQVFEPFFTTKGEQGTGLGLSVTHGIVQSHGGTITVESRLGAGTTFNVYFPTLE